MWSAISTVLHRSQPHCGLFTRKFKKKCKFSVIHTCLDLLLEGRMRSANQMYFMITTHLNPNIEQNEWNKEGGQTVSFLKFPLQIYLPDAAATSKQQQQEWCFYLFADIKSKPLPKTITS